MYIMNKDTFVYILFCNRVNWVCVCLYVKTLQLSTTDIKKKNCTNYWKFCVR